MYGRYLGKARGGGNLGCYIMASAIHRRRNQEIEILKSSAGLKNAIFRDVMQCDPSKSRRFGGIYRGLPQYPSASFTILLNLRYLLVNSKHVQSHCLCIFLISYTNRSIITNFHLQTF
jgi:hypothetical protein